MTDKVEIKITGDSKEFQKASLNAQKSAKDLNTQIISSAKLATGAFIALGSVITSKLVTAYAEQEQAELRTKQTLEATGYAAGLTSKELFNMASALQEVTTYGDETIIAGQNLLLTFKNIGAENFPRATEAMLDMATAMGTDLKSAAIQVGKALNDPATGLTMLTRVGVTFTDEQKGLIKSLNASGQAAEAQRVILQELESQFGGAARAAAEGSGQFKKVANIVGDAAEKMGGALTTLAATITQKLDLEGVAKYWDNFIKGSIDSEKSSAELKEEIAALDKEIKTLDKTMKEGESNPFYDKFGKAEEDMEKYADATARQTELTKRLNVVEREEYKESAEFKAKILAESKTREREAAAASIALTEKKNAKLAENAEVELEIEKQKQDSLVEFGFETTETKLANLQSEIAAEAALKQKAQIDELIKKGEFDKAKQKQDELNLKLREKTLQMELKQEKDFFNTAVSLANSRNKTLAAIGKAAGLVQIAQKTPTAVANSYEFGTRVGGPVLGGIFGGIAAAAMAAQAAQLADVKGFADGGVVGGMIGARTGSDDTLATVKTGEMILNAQQQEQLFNAISSGALGGDGETDVNINLNAGAFADAFEIEIVKRDRENRTPLAVR